MTLENILEASETNFMESPPHVFDVDHVAKIKSELKSDLSPFSRKKMDKIIAWKNDFTGISKSDKLSFESLNLVDFFLENGER